jgi:hypothetical protein
MDTAKSSGFAKITRILTNDFFIYSIFLIFFLVAIWPPFNYFPRHLDCPDPLDPLSLSYYSHIYTIHEIELDISDVLFDFFSQMFFFAALTYITTVLVSFKDILSLGFCLGFLTEFVRSFYYLDLVDMSYEMSIVTQKVFHLGLSYGLLCA